MNKNLSFSNWIFIVYRLSLIKMYYDFILTSVKILTGLNYTEIII